MLWGLILVLVISIGTISGCSKDQSQKVSIPTASPAGKTPEPVPDGEALFRQYCSSCHPNGGNASDPERTLHGSVLKKKHITSSDDIVRIMRNPLSRMIRFDAATLPDRDARAIADYVLKTFK
jgi:cytochrome c6